MAVSDDTLSSISTPDRLASRSAKDADGDRLDGARAYRLTLPADIPEGNWIQTTEGKGWFPILRLYSPLAPFFDKTWRPGEIEAAD